MIDKLALSALFLLSGCAAIPMGPRHNTVVDGNTITYVQTNLPAPTVVFEAGLGDGLGAWADVYAATSEFANVFAYSRPGYSPGFQRPAIGRARTADRSAALLRALLRQTGAPPPYVLVGHSIGGLYVLEFARDYPALVAAMVLVDARLPGFTERCESAGLSPCMPPVSALLLAPPHIAAEIRGIRASESNAPGPAEFGNVPAILLAATKPPPGAPPGAQAIWLAVQEDYADGMSNGRFIVAEGSGHYIQRDAPSLVVRAIREAVETAARRKRPSSNR